MAAKVILGTLLTALVGMLVFVAWSRSGSWQMPAMLVLVMGLAVLRGWVRARRYRSIDE